MVRRPATKGHQDNMFKKLQTGEKIHDAPTEPTAIRLTLERLQESAS